MQCFFIIIIITIITIIIITNIIIIPIIIKGDIIIIIIMMTLNSSCLAEEDVHSPPVVAVLCSVGHVALVRVSDVPLPEIDARDVDQVRERLQERPTRKHDCERPLLLQSASRHHHPQCPHKVHIHTHTCSKKILFV